MTNAGLRGIIYLAFAGVAHLVERDLAKVEVASSSLVARSKKKHHPLGWCFLFGMPRAGWNSLPRPARSALNQEVRQGSCEWLCHSWDAGSESSLAMFFAFAACRGTDNKTCGQSQKETPSVRMVFSFWTAAGRMELTASTGAKRVNSGGEAGLPRMALPFVGCRVASSSLVYFAAQSVKNKETPSCRMVFSFS